MSGHFVSGQHVGMETMRRLRNMGRELEREGILWSLCENLACLSCSGGEQVWTKHLEAFSTERKCEAVSQNTSPPSQIIMTTFLLVALLPLSLLSNFPYALEGSYKTQIWSSIFHSVLNSPFFLVYKKLNSFTDYAKSFMILPLPVHSASIFLILTPDFMIRQ